MEGERVGDVLGSAVGINVGTSVGPDVGSVDGEGVLVVGDTVGSSDGLALGSLAAHYAVRFTSPDQQSTNLEMASDQQSEHPSDHA